jgi:tetratricopeptide (TPR) repeat protein
MTGRRFAVWEGGALSVADDWTEAHLLRGVQRMAAGQPREALADFQAAGNVPENLPSESRDGTAHRVEIAYRIGTAYEALGDPVKAKASWAEAAATGSAGAGRRRGGFSDRGTQGYYRALALRKLGQTGPAETALRGMSRSAEAPIKAASPDVDRSAPFTAQRAQRSRRAQPHLLAGLGHLGLGEKDIARKELTEALRIDPACLDARAALREIEGPVKP